ncbi:MAG: hypothetical protein ABI992_04400 [Chthoniobacterales bacterium]
MNRLYIYWICFASFLACAPLAAALDGVPGLDVVAMRGSAIASKVVTDEKGRFQTGPLEPGVYTIEVRTVANTPPTSGRYFLALVGGRPLGDARIRSGVALAMEVQVRNSAGIKGQVTARGFIYVPRRSTTATTGNAVSTMPSLPSKPAGTVPHASASARPANATRNAALPAPVGNASAAQPVSVNNANFVVVPRPANVQPRIINGRRYLWVPTVPGSNFGRWLPENVSRPVSNAPLGSTPKPSPAAR